MRWLARGRPTPTRSLTTLTTDALVAQALAPLAPHLDALIRYVDRSDSGECCVSLASPFTLYGVAETGEVAGSELTAREEGQRVRLPLL